MTEAFDLIAWREHVLKTTRQNQPQTPQGDWTGVFLVEEAEEMVIMPTSPYRATAAVWEKALTLWFPAMLIDKAARAYALVDHIWQSESAAAHLAGTAVDPNRNEAVLIVIGARVGNREVVQESWDARVSRIGEGPPLLGPWREHLRAEGTRFGPLQAALRYLTIRE